MRHWHDALRTPLGHALVADQGSIRGAEGGVRWVDAESGVRADFALEKLGVRFEAGVEADDVRRSFGDVRGDGA